MILFSGHEPWESRVVGQDRFVPTATATAYSVLRTPFFIRIIYRDIIPPGTTRDSQRLRSTYPQVWPLRTIGVGGEIRSVRLRMQLSPGSLAFQPSILA